MSQQDLLWKKGTPQMLVLLADRGMTFSEIHDQMRISESTLTNRLDEGKTRNWWATTVDDSGSRRSQVYQLLPEGHKMVQKLDELELAELADRQREITLEYRRRVDELSQGAP